MTIFFICNKFVHFSFPWTLLGNSPNILCSRLYRTRWVSFPFYIPLQTVFKTTLCISKLVNLNYTFEISLKVIIIGTASKFHNDIHLKILLIFMCFSGILHIIKGKAFMKKNITKISELSNFKCSLASHVNKIRDF